MFEKIKSILRGDIQEQKYALADDEQFGRISAAKKPDKWVDSTCGYCGVGCGLVIGVKEGKAVYTKGNPKHPVNIGTLCPKGLSEHEILAASNRILAPKIRKSGKLENASWDEAYRLVSDKFKEVQKNHGAKAIGVISTGQLLTEEFYTLGKFVQLGLGTNNYDGNTTLCMASAVMGYKQSFGSDGPPGSYEDFEYADVIFLIGANIADNHPILKLHIAKNKKKPKIVVIDPRRTKTSQMADIYVPLKPRSDLALLNTLAFIILEQGWENEEYIRANTNGFKEFKKHIQNYPPQDVANITGLDVKMLYELARVYAGADAAMIAWTMGVNQSALGTDTVSAINNLALLTGNIGKQGASPFSLTGQCNAMGTRESGFTSSLPGYRNFASQKDREEYANIINVDPNIVPTERGYKYNEIIEAIESGEIKALWVVATNPLVSFVNQERLRKALANLELLVVQDAFMSETAQIADVIFSAATWGEKEGSYTNSERRVNRAKKAVEPPSDTKSDFDIIVDFAGYFNNAKNMLYPQWNSPLDAFNEWKKVSSGRLCDYSDITYEKIEHVGVQWGGDRLYSKEASFATDDGRANFICADWVPLSENSSKEFPLILNTGRTVEQWHTRTKTKTIDILNNAAPEAWIEINPSDANLLEVKSGDRVDISGARGVVKQVIVKVTQTIAPKTVFVPFHFSSELINILTPSEFCPKSGEPNFKQSAIQLHSQKVPQGIVYKELQSAGEIELEKSSTLKATEKEMSLL